MSRETKILISENIREKSIFLDWISQSNSDDGISRTTIFDDLTIDLLSPEWETTRDDGEREHMRGII